MTQSEQTPSVSSTPPETAVEKTTTTVDQSEQQSAPTPAATSITADQAEQIIAQLKSLKQNVFILTLVAGFFALRAILFHR